MTWTLAAMTSCYCLSVGPIFVCTLLEIEAGTPYLLCFILYWFQVIFHCLNFDKGPYHHLTLQLNLCL